MQNHMTERKCVQAIQREQQQADTGKSPQRADPEQAPERLLAR
jgi:hypothetical protein